MQVENNQTGRALVLTKSPPHSIFFVRWGYGNQKDLARAEKLRAMQAKCMNIGVLESIHGAESSNEYLSSNLEF